MDKVFVSMSEGVDSSLHYKLKNRITAACANQECMHTQAESVVSVASYLQSSWRANNEKETPPTEEDTLLLQ